MAAGLEHLHARAGLVGQIVQAEQAGHQQVRMRIEEGLHRQIDARQTIGREVRHREFTHMLRHGAVGARAVEVLELVDARLELVALEALLEVGELGVVELGLLALGLLPLCGLAFGAAQFVS